MDYTLLESKRDYLNSLGSFSLEQLNDLREYVISVNAHSQPSQEETFGLRIAYSNLDCIMKEESSFPYPPNYRHPLSEDMLKLLNRNILEYYYYLLYFEKGEYRTGEHDKIGGVLLPPRDVFIPGIKELIEWYNDEKDNTFRKLAIFHMSFLRHVHPFYDGNGRTARTFINLELARANYPMIGLKYSDEDKYYKSFEMSDKESYRFMEELIYTNVEKELNRLLLLKTGN